MIHLPIQGSFEEQARQRAREVIGETYGIWRRDSFEGAASVMGITEFATATHGSITQLTAGARRYAKLATGIASAYWRTTTFATPMVSDTTAKKFYGRFRLAFGGVAVTGASSRRGVELFDGSGNPVVTFGQVSTGVSGAVSGAGSATNLSVATFNGTFQRVVNLSETVPSAVTDLEIWGDTTNFYARAGGSAVPVAIPAAQGLSPACNLYGSVAGDASNIDVYRVFFAFEE